MSCHGVTTISRLLKIMGLFCKRALSKRRYSTKETYDFKEPTNCSRPILSFPAMDFCIELIFGDFGSRAGAIYCDFYTHTHTHTHRHRHALTHTHTNTNTPTYQHTQKCAHTLSCFLSLALSRTHANKHAHSRVVP